MSARAEQQSRHKKAKLIGTELEHQALEAELLEMSLAEGNAMLAAACA
jgi:hypothetical protein